jgi:pimeloyl-ACP methyl ester carboxylesterase
LIVHGYSDKKGSWRLARLINEIKEEFSDEAVITPDYLERYGPRVLVGIIFGRKALEEYAKKVLKEAEQAEQLYGPITIIIGYSMGGLIARYVAKRLAHVEKLILVATPNLGLRIGRLKRLFLRRIKCLTDSLPDSDFLKKLNEELPLKYKCYIVAGSKDEFAPLESSLAVPDVPDEQKAILPLGHSELIPPPTSKEQGAIEEIVQLCSNS